MSEDSGPRTKLTPIQRYKVIKCLDENRDRLGEMNTNEIVHLIEGDTQLRLSLGTVRNFLRTIGVKPKSNRGSGMRKLVGLPARVDELTAAVQGLRDDVAAVKSRMFAIEQELGISEAIAAHVNGN